MSENFDLKIKKYFYMEKCIGNGTFSTVFQVRHVQNGQRFALKKIFIKDIQVELAKIDYYNEVQLLKRLQHPNIIKYIHNGYYKNDGTLNIILELASLGDLSYFISDHIKKMYLVPEEKIWKFTTQLSSAVDYMHLNRIIHRDLKPANIFLSENEDIKIGDFGMGEFCPDKTKLYSVSVVGTPYYMSPERLLQGKYFFNSDVWSLGCVIYEQLAALQSPFYVNKLDINLLIKRVIKCDFPPLPCDAFSEETSKVGHKLKNIIINVDVDVKLGEVQALAKNGSSRILAKLKRNGDSIISSNVRQNLSFTATSSSSNTSFNPVEILTSTPLQNESSSHSTEPVQNKEPTQELYQANQPSTSSANTHAETYGSLNSTFLIPSPFKNALHFPSPKKPVKQEKNDTLEKEKECRKRKQVQKQNEKMVKRKLKFTEKVKIFNHDENVEEKENQKWQSDPDNEIESFSEDEENTKVNEGDFVLVKFKGKDREIYYVAKVMKVLVPDKEFKISFLRKISKVEDALIFPLIKDESHIGAEDIVFNLKTTLISGTVHPENFFYKIQL
ncbi:hypothetical protein PGB90_010587 [Kerria lacca]